LRAFTWVKDIVDGIYLTSTCSPEYYNNEWNIGNERNETTIMYLAEKCKQYVNSESKISHVDPVKLHGHLFSEAPEKIPNSGKIRKLLGWKPNKSVDDVILEVISYYTQK
jgi:nucleoside-diphosphate-sugar epimerase